MRINLISRDNGVGLTTDVALLRQTFATHDVEFVDWTASSMRPCDAALFLELWNPALLRFARHTVGVFNLEWFSHTWQRDLPRISQLWAKSHEAYWTYQRLGLPTVLYTGFAGRDLYDATVPRTLSCLHVRGNSGFKGTRRVLDAWARNPDLPPLTIISADSMRVPPNVTLIGRCSDAELRRHMNAATIHICPSAAEGWGHYIVEGLSVGAVVITTDASPMREHIREGGGILIPVAGRSAYGLVHMNDVRAVDLATAVHRVTTLSDTEREIIGQCGRTYLQARNAAFRILANQAMAALC